MCTISFGTSYSIRIPEDDVRALQDVLLRAVNQLSDQRNEAEEFESTSREAEEEMAAEADDYNPEEEIFKTELFSGTLEALDDLVDVIK